MIYKPISLHNRRSDINVSCEKLLLCLMCDMSSKVASAEKISDSLAALAI